MVSQRFAKPSTERFYRFDPCTLRQICSCRIMVLRLTCNQLIAVRIRTGAPSLILKIPTTAQFRKYRCGGHLFSNISEMHRVESGILVIFD